MDHVVTLHARSVIMYSIMQLSGPQRLAVFCPMLLCFAVMVKSALFSFRRESLPVREAHADSLFPLTSTHCASCNPSFWRPPPTIHPSIFHTCLSPLLLLLPYHTGLIQYISYHRSLWAPLWCIKEETRVWPVIWTVCNEKNSSRKARNIVHVGCKWSKHHSFIFYRLQLSVNTMHITVSSKWLLTAPLYMMYI